MSSTKTYQNLLIYHWHQNPQIICPLRSGPCLCPFCTEENPDSSWQACVTVSRTTIYSQIPWAPVSWGKAELGESRAGKQGGQMNQEATTQTTFQISQSHLVAIPGDEQCRDTQEALDNWTQSPSCLKWGHKLLWRIKQYLSVSNIKMNTLSSRRLQISKSKKPAMPVHNFL